MSPWRRLRPQVRKLRFVKSIRDVHSKATTTTEGASGSTRESIESSVSGQTRFERTRCLGQRFFDSPSFGDLSNPVHNIFHEQNFIDPAIRYKTLEYSLRLASRFITTPELLPFWYMILHGPIELATSNADDAWFKSPTTLTDEEKREVLRRLELLASCIALSSERSWGRGDTASTERLKLDAPSPFRGVKSHIYISKRVFRSIERSFAQPCLDNKSRLWSHFLLVNLILHELAHAAMYAAHPRPPAHDPIQAYFLPGARTTEEGMEWENSVFGGLMYEIPSFLFQTRKTGMLDTEIVLREWPAPRLVSSYRKNMYPRPFPVKGELPKHDRVWLVPPTFFERLFTTSFWERTVPKEGARVLRPALNECFVSRGPMGLLVPDP